MRGFDDKFLTELKEKNDIVDVIGHYVKLDKKGASFWGRCPFHHEKTASFCVNPISNFFYCFGCHKSGDVITFIREIESLDFGDAVKFLAERVKMPLPEMKYDDEQVKEAKHKKERALALLKDTALFYVNNLKSEKAVKHIEYILKRGFTSQTVARFGLGASLDFDSLPKYLLSKGYTKEELVESGACGEKNGRYYDFLGGRLIIPAIDQFNNVVAFDGRRIDDVKEQKYINTRETIVFSKGKTLFNINNLKKIKNQTGLDGVILVEGHLDVVSLSQGGFPNVVASMGTAFGKDQARMLKRYVDKVFVSYDGDFAGQNATIKSLDILQDEGLEVKVLSLPDGLDPDEVIRQLGADKYRELLIEAKPLIDFKLEVLKKSFDITTVDGKRKYTQSAIKVINESKSASEQEDLLKTVGRITGFTFESLKRELFNAQSGEENLPKPLPVETVPEKAGDKFDTAGRFILCSYLFNKDYVNQIEGSLSQFEFTLPIHESIRDYILEKKANNEMVNFSDLYELLPNGESELSKIAGMETDYREGKFKIDEEQYFKDCAKTLAIYSYDKRLEFLNKKYLQETDTETRKTIASELQRLISEKKLIK